VLDGVSADYTRPMRSWQRVAAVGPRHGGPCGLAA